MENLDILNNILNNIFKFLVSPQSSKIFFAIKIVFFIISGIFVYLIIILLFKTTWLKRRYMENLIEIVSFKSYELAEFKKRWKKINSHLKNRLENEGKLAVIEINNLLDEVLIKLGYQGENLEEKLEKAKLDFSLDIESLKNIYFTRNEIVQNPDFHLPIEEAEKIVFVCKKFLTDLKIL